MDCVVCHDTTGNYSKPPGLAGNVVTADTEFPPGSGKILKAIDLTKIAQKVGKTSRDTCGACHFNGGGGDGVKHGDLDSSMAAPDKELDVHMDAAGLDFTCATCHKTSSHDVAGSRYTPTAKDAKGAHLRGTAASGNPATCVSCHGTGPHKSEARLNEHAAKVACQTCHIPTFARGGVPTKMTWDWSTAGKRDAKGKPITRKDAKGRVIYESRKGDFTLAENVKPEYAWFNGEVKYTLLTDKIEKSSRAHAHQRAGRQRGGRQVDDLADEGVPRLAAVRPGQQDADHAAHRRQRRHGVLEEPRLGQGHPGRHDRFGRALLGQVRLHQDGNVLAHHAHGRAQGEGARLRRLPRGQRPARRDRGRVPARARRQRVVDRAGWALALLVLAASAVHGAKRIVSRGNRQGGRQ